MRDNGIQGLPDPQVTEDGFLLVGFPVVLPENWDEAQEACQDVHDDAAASEESAGGDATDWSGKGRAGRRLPLCRRQRVRLLGAPR